MPVFARTLLPVLLAAAGVTGQAMAVPSGHVPSAGPAAPTESFTRHPYVAALATVANYHGCGVHARAGRVAELNAALQAGEAAARAKGLGPALEQLHQHYYRMLSVSTMVVCVQGPGPALAGARRALAAFRQWVATQPAR